MIRFSARVAYVLLVPQGRALISLLRNNRMIKTKLQYFLKRNNNRSCNSKQYTVNVHDQLTGISIYFYADIFDSVTPGGGGGGGAHSHRGAIEVCAAE